MDCIYRLAKPAPTTATLRELETLQHVLFPSVTLRFSFTHSGPDKWQQSFEPITTPDRC